MARKSGAQYADEVRELRAAGFEFPASAGYRLADAANWNRGQKAAVTRAFNTLEFEEEESIEPDTGLDPGEAELFFDDGAGDAQEEWDDIDFFDFEEAEDLIDEEADRYTED